MTAKITLGTTEERSQRVRYVREKVLRLSRLEFSRRSGISPNSLQNWEQGRNEYTGVPEHSAKRLVEAFKKEGVECTLEWLLYGIGDAPAYPSLTHSGSAALHIQDKDIIKEELALFRRLNGDILDTIIHDDAMSPCFWPGDIVAGKRYEGEHIKKFLGLPCIVQTITGNTLVRLLAEGEKPEVYNLICTNSQAMARSVVTNAELVSAAPIIWVRKKIHII